MKPKQKNKGNTTTETSKNENNSNDLNKSDTTNNTISIKEEVKFTSCGDRTYIAEKILGRGTFGVVYKAYLSGNSAEKVAIKKYFKTFNPISGHLELSILIFLSKLIKDDLVLKIIDGNYIEDKGEMFMVTKYLENQRFIDFYKSFNIKQIQTYMYQLLLSLKSIHDLGLIHRDVKPDNFLFNPKTNESCLIDFGLAEPDIESKEWRTLENDLTDDQKEDYEKINTLSKMTTKHKLGTRGFLPPEVIFHCPYQTKAVDVFSAGVILLDFLSQRFPIFNLNQFSRITSENIKDLIPFIIVFGREKVEEAAAENKCPIYIGSALDSVRLKNGLETLISQKWENEEDKKIIDDAKDLMYKMLELDQKKRITTNEALKHSFFKGVSSQYKNNESSNNNVNDD